MKLGVYMLNSEGWQDLETVQLGLANGIWKVYLRNRCDTQIMTQIWWILNKGWNSAQQTNDLLKGDTPHPWWYNAVYTVQSCDMSPAHWAWREARCWNVKPEYHHVFWIVTIFISTCTCTAWRISIRDRSHVMKSEQWGTSHFSCVPGTSHFSYVLDETLHMYSKFEILHILNYLFHVAGTRLWKLHAMPFCHQYLSKKGANSATRK